MTQASHIIAKFGGVNRMARALNRTASTVQGWKDRGIIPPGHWEDILRVSAELGVDVVREDFVAHLPADAPKSMAIAAA
jgi:alpha-D-ribose 1-methylphosphonate 5-triphosphate diphosphatase PhnM